MSGTLSQPSGVPAIAYTPTNPLTQATQAAQLGNTVAENALIRQSTQNAVTQGQQQNQNLQIQAANRAAQVNYGLMNLTDSQLAGGQPVRDALSAERDNGTITPQAYETYMANLPSPNAPVSAWRQSINSHFVGQLAGPDALRAITGSQVPTTIPGGQTQIQQVPGPLAAPGTQVTPVGQPVGGGLSPEAGATRQPVVGQNNQPGTLPLGAMPGSPGVPLGGGPAMPVPPVPPPSGAPLPRPGMVVPPQINIPSPINPPRLGGAVQPSQGGAPAPVNPPGFVATSPIPGTQQNIDAAGQRFAADSEALTQFPQRVQPLLEALKVAPNSRTGPGSAQTNEIAAFLQSRGIQAPAADMNQTAAYDLLTKNLQRYANSLPQAQSSDAGLAAAISGNPHATMTSLGLHDALVQTLALERMQAALRKNYTGAPNGPAYQAYLQDQSTKIDPRAFVNDELGQAGRARVFGTLTTPQQYQNYKDSLAMARGTGVTTDTAFPPPQQPPAGIVHAVTGIQ